VGGAGLRRPDPSARPQEEVYMRRVAIALVAVASMMGVAAVAMGSVQAKKGPTQITIWVGWSARELSVFKSLVAEYDKAHPEVTVKVVGSMNDDKIIAALHSGDVPDVMSSFTSANVGNYCSSGGWIDLAPLLKKSHLSASVFPKTSQYYTQYKGKRCALPLLADTYGLYYNKTLFKKAGIKSPPKTMSELVADAKKLTVKDAKGNLKVVGYDPFFGFMSGNMPDMEQYAPLYGAKYVDSKDHSILSKDPQWAKFLKWQKAFIDWYGYDKLVKFNATTSDEFSASNAFEIGKVAMMGDGEWRVAFIAAEHPTLNYGTAPMPVDNAHPELYGAGDVNGTIIGIPKGVKHLDQAWDLLKYLTFNTHFLAQFSNGIRNVPTTKASLTSKELKPDKHFAAFLKIFANPHSTTTPITAVGNAWGTLVTNFTTKWQAGKISNLQDGLKTLDKQIDDQLAAATGP
jgi:multiple sugar transport system substrate-binding protein